MPLELVYETHATTVDNENGVATGWLPGLLSACGRAEAAEMGERRRDAGLAAVYSSDLARAVETTTIGLGDSSIPVHLDARLRKCDHGELNGCLRDAFSQRAARIDVPFGGGQSYLEVVGNTQSLLTDLRRDHEGERVLLVAHSANRWARQHLLDGIHLEDLVDAPFDWQPGWHWTLL